MCQGRLRAFKVDILHSISVVVIYLQSLKNLKCAICRADFPDELLDEPDLLMPMDANASTNQEKYQWFYQGRNGWWQFDERTSQDIEKSFGNGDEQCTIFVAGYVYVLDFDQMLQQRRNDPSRKRKVKRDLATMPKLGIAGIHLPVASESANANNGR